MIFRISKTNSETGKAETSVSKYVWIESNKYLFETDFFFSF